MHHTTHVLLVLTLLALESRTGDPLFAQSARERTPGEVAANGPFPGDLSLYQKELAGATERTSPGYYPSLNAAEIADSQRSGFFPAATFTGSFDGPNRVYASRSADRYQGLTYLCNRRPGELFLVGGDYPPPTGPLPPGPYVARVDATTGRQIWRTYVDNANVSGRWIGNGNLNIMDDGNIRFAWSNQIVLIDGDSGLILRHNTLPSGTAPQKDVNYKHLTIAPDRTLILKCQTRPTGETSQGTIAIFKGLAAGKKQPNSHLVAVHPDTLEVLAETGLPEPASAPHIITTLGGRIVTYIPVDSGVLRYFWDPETQQLSRDESWMMKAQQEGQSASTAATLIGDWVAVQTNGAGSFKMASSIVVVHQDDASRTHTIFPFGDLGNGEWSFAPPKAGVDPENNMLYSGRCRCGQSGRHPHRPGNRHAEGRLCRRRPDHHVPTGHRHTQAESPAADQHEDERSLAADAAGYVRRKLPRAADLARRGNRTHPGGVGLFRAADHQLADDARLWRTDLLPDDQ